MTRAAPPAAGPCLGQGDCDAQRLGVIDWGLSRLSDPALDLASITAGSERLGAAVLERVPHLRDRAERSTP